MLWQGVLWSHIRRHPVAVILSVSNLIYRIFKAKFPRLRDATCPRPWLLAAGWWLYGSPEALLSPANGSMCKMKISGRKSVKSMYTVYKYECQNMGPKLTIDLASGIGHWLEQKRQWGGSSVSVIGAWICFCVSRRHLSTAPPLQIANVKVGSAGVCVQRLFI